MRRTSSTAVLLSGLVALAAACSDGATPTGPTPSSDAAPSGLATLPAHAAATAEPEWAPYGPVTFVRGRGKPETVRRELSLDGWSGPFTLHVRNGDASGGRRSSSARVALDGTEVVGPSAFTPRFAGGAYEVEPSSATPVLEVWLASAPGSEVTIWIDGVPQVLAVEVAPAEVELDRLGATAQIEAIALGPGGRPMPDEPIAWSSSDPDVATVSAEGRVTSVGNGEATITAASGGASASATVGVQQVAATVQVTPDAATLTPDAATAQLTGTVLDAGGSEVAGAAITWSSSDEGVATVDGDGLVTAVAGGQATITAASGGASGSAAVEVAAPSTLIVAPVTVELAWLGATAQLSATEARSFGLPDVDVTGTVAWSSTDESVATVDAGGLVTAVGAGSATIAATLGADLHATVGVTVAPVGVAVDVAPGSATLSTSAPTVQLTATVRDAGGSEVAGAAIVWSSSDESVATVDADGLVTAAGNGQATITAASGDAEGSASVAVDLVPEPASVEVTPGALTLTSLVAPGQLGAAVLDAAGDPVPGAGVTWSSSDPSVATVAQDGRVTAVADGTATITATHEGLTGTADVTVAIAAPSITSLVVSPTSIVLSADGYVFDFTMTIANPGGYSSFATGVTVSQGGSWHDVGISHACHGGADPCTLGGTIRRLNASPFTAGPAVVTVSLSLDTGGPVAVAQAPVQLFEADADPTLDAFVLPSTTLSLDASVFASVTVTNPSGGAVTDLVVQAFVDQGSATRGAGGGVVRCSSQPPFGVIQAGSSCTYSQAVRATNSGAGTGTLVPGPATLRVELEIQVGSSVTRLDTLLLPITLGP